MLQGPQGGAGASGRQGTFSRPCNLTTDSLITARHWSSAFPPQFAPHPTRTPGGCSHGPHSSDKNREALGR